MRETIIILGGSPLQRDLLTTAKENYKVILIDGDDNCNLRHLADNFYHLDFSNTDKLYELATQIKPKLILTIANEQGNLSAAVVSEKLGIKYNCVDVVFSTLNKAAMKKVMLESNISTARYKVINKNVQFIELWKDATFPLIIKPSQSSGGRGVQLVDTNEELIDATSIAKAMSKDRCAIVEEYIPATQYSVETISCNGTHYILGITNEYFGEAPFFTETQQLFPSDIDKKTVTKLKSFTLKALDAFMIKYGACHLEVRVTSEGKIYLIEIASRAGGWRSELIKYANGINYTDLLIKSYQLDHLNIKKKFDKYSIVKMLFNETDLTLYKQLENDPNYLVSPITWTKNVFAAQQKSLMDSSGYYFITATNLEDALHAI